MNAHNRIRRSPVARTNLWVAAVLAGCYASGALAQSCAENLPTATVPRVDDYRAAIRCLEAQQSQGASQPLSVPVGAIFASVINPDNMKDVYKSAFVLADGRNVSTQSAYAKLFGETRVPDLRGMFLRGLNVGRFDGKQDPDNTRDPGGYQPDQNRSHTHSTVQMVYDNNVDGVDSTVIHSGEHHNEDKQTGTSGGDEARPKNVAVYYYIRVN